MTKHGVYKVTMLLKRRRSYANKEKIKHWIEGDWETADYYPTNIRIERVK